MIQILEKKNYDFYYIQDWWGISLTSRKSIPEKDIRRKHKAKYMYLNKIEVIYNDLAKLNINIGKILDCSSRNILIFKLNGLIYHYPLTKIIKRKRLLLNITNCQDKTQYFINKASLLHKNKYNYSLVNYISTDENVKIICPNHGVFNQTPHSHYKSGCTKCGYEIVQQARLNSTAYFIKKAKEIHGNLYDYSLVNYTHSSNKVTIICPIHNKFEQAAQDHVRGSGCAECGLDARGYKEWKSNCKKKGDKAIFYVLYCWNNLECFYKIGITKNTVKYRYGVNIGIKMPYNYKITQEIQGDCDTIWNLELKLKKFLKSYHYTPKIDFKGSVYECFKPD